MSTYMHSEYIEESIRSVWAQNYPNLEICIVDDCSSDDTFEILKRLKALAPFPMDIFRNQKAKKEWLLEEVMEKQLLLQ